MNVRASRRALEALCRAVHRVSQTVDFILTTQRDAPAARRFFERAVEVHDAPGKVTIDKSGANAAAVRGLMADGDLSVELRQSKYLNNVVEPNRRAVKRRVRSVLGFGRFHTASNLIAGIETTHAIRNGQLDCHISLATS